MTINSYRLVGYYIKDLTDSIVCYVDVQGLLHNTHIHVLNLYVLLVYWSMLSST